MINNLYNKMTPFIKFSAAVLFIFSSSLLVASDLSDATDLRERCEKEITGLEVSVKNFGDNANIEDFNKGEKLVKLGKVKYIQTKYTDAIDIYNKYLVIQFNLYEILAQKYIDRTEKIIDNVGEDLVDYVNDKKVVEYLQLATQRLKDAKAAMASKHYKNIIDVLRAAKNYALGAYKLVGKNLPDQYKVDAEDNEGKILNKEISPATK